MYISVWGELSYFLFLRKKVKPPIYLYTEPGSLFHISTTPMNPKTNIYDMSQK